MRRTALAFAISVLAASVLGLAARAEITPQKQRGQIVQKLYTPVRALDKLRTGYQRQIHQLEKAKAQAGAEREKMVSQAQAEGKSMPWLTNDKAVRARYESLGTQAQALATQIDQSRYNLHAVESARADLAGVLKTALRDGTRESRDASGKGLRRMRIDGANGTLKIVAEALVQPGNGRFGLAVRHTEGREAGKAAMPGYKDISLHGAEVELGKSQLMIKLSGHYSESGGPTTIVKTFNLRPSTGKDAFSISQVRPND